jgi:hypothetical protein
MAGPYCMMFIQLNDHIMAEEADRVNASGALLLRERRNRKAITKFTGCKHIGYL